MSDTDTLEDFPLVRGWTPALQTQFLDHLALKGNVAASCKRVGLSREAAYRLRRRDPLFARGWAAAMVKAHDHCIEVLADRAIEGIEEPIYHRGELVGTRRKYDNRLLLAHIARLDKAAEDEAAQADAGRFDELLARIGGEELPEGMDSEDGVLPVDRESLSEDWAMEADREFAEAEADAEAEGEVLDEEAAAARNDEAVAAFRAAQALGERYWDSWFLHACRRVDRTTGWRDELPARDGETGARDFSPWTLSEVSTGALARAMASPAAGVVPPPAVTAGQAGMP
jgi:hypothetical protein